MLMKTIALTRRCIQMALAGDDLTMRLCMERIHSPRKDRLVAFLLPPTTSAQRRGHHGGGRGRGGGRDHQPERSRPIFQFVHTFQIEATDFLRLAGFIFPYEHMNCVHDAIHAASNRWANMLTEG